MAARFLLVLGHELRGQLAPAWPGAGRDDRPGVGDGPWVAWRLLGSNHRELARSARIYDTTDAACAAIALLRARLDDAAVTTVISRGRWDWQLAIDGEPFAVASRPYQRPRECAYNLDVTVAAIRAAAVIDVKPRVPHPAAPADESSEMDHA